MADILDQADEASDAFFRAALSTTKKPEGPKPDGYCYACSARLEVESARWCDDACRDDYEHEQRRLDA